MLGLINDCTEQLVISKFGIDAWHAIKEKAGCDVKDYGFVRHEPYPDKATVDIVVAAAETLGVSVDDVLELFGQYFLEYTRENGYDNLMKCQGSTLRLWLSSLNALHDHLQSSLPTGCFPVFWCEDCEDTKGSILLHYYSVRGSLLAQLVVGLVGEISKFYFDVEITMDRVETQGENGSECTTWRISAVDPEKQWKLTGSGDEEHNLTSEVVQRTMIRRNSNSGRQTQEAKNETNGNAATGQLTCPFTGVPMPKKDSKQRTLTKNQSEVSLRALLAPKQDPGPIEDEVDEEEQAERNAIIVSRYDLGLSSNKVRMLFPYHIVVNDNFRILQVGDSLPPILQRHKKELIGRNIEGVLKITKPVLGAWDWPTLQKLADQTFFLMPVARRRDSLQSRLNDSISKFDESLSTLSNNGDEEKKVRTPNESMPHAHSGVRFKGSMVRLSRHKAMFVLSPDVANISELSGMGLTMSDLPLHSFQRDAVFLGEHIASEVRSAHKLDKLSKRLHEEKNLSNTLLYNMLPQTVADQLRRGRTVEPSLFENVTLFFSDVVGFTEICDAIEPWDVVDMLNQLYSVMDYLSSHFNLYKVETVGDAYMCCSGLPMPDVYHAENVANFALAVKECVKHVCSPANGSPLQLRIGLHTGHCMGGVVGTLTPHYCLFGDMVNTTARHESTGLPGRIQCSSVLYGRLKHFSPEETDQFNLAPRGLVKMKGKDDCYTYWLESGTEENKATSPTAIAELYERVGQMLAEEKWKKRKYFRRFRDNSSVASSWEGGLLDTEVTPSLASLDISMHGDDEDDDPNALSGQWSNAGSELDDMQKRLDELDDLIVSPPTKIDDEVPQEDAFTSRSICSQESWAAIGWSEYLTTEDLVAHVHDLMFGILCKCVVDDSGNLPDDLDLLGSQLFGFIRQMSMYYNSAVRFHNWRHACHVVLGTSYLIEKTQQAADVDTNPWIRFTIVFAALIHDVKHVGVPNRQLETENHVLCQVYDSGSCLERQSIHVGTSIFIEKFPELSAVVLKGFPKFLHFVNTAVLATDTASMDTQRRTREKCERVLAAEDMSSPERTETILEHILLLADVGHCSQKYSTFLTWNETFYEECLMNYMSARGEDPRTCWFENQIGFLENYILPLADRWEQLLTRSFGVKEGVVYILQRWNRNGYAWTNQMISGMGSDSSGNEQADENAETIQEADEESEEDQDAVRAACPFHNPEESPLATSHREEEAKERSEVPNDRGACPFHNPTTIPPNLTAIRLESAGGTEQPIQKQNPKDLAMPDEPESGPLSKVDGEASTNPESVPAGFIPPPQTNSCCIIL